MNKSVLILALGDIYWTRFAVSFSRLLSERGIPTVIVLESRVGEYQAYWHRCDYPDAKVYYLTDFINFSGTEATDCDAGVVMCDYLRVKTLGQMGKLFNTDWSAVAKYINAFTRHVIGSERIGLIISDQVSTSLSYSFCEAATENGIEFWGLSGSRLAGRFVMAKTVASEAEHVKSFYDEIVSGAKPVSKDERAWAVNYVAEIDAQVPDYMRSPILNKTSPSKFIKGRYLKSLIGAFIYTLAERADKNALVIKALPLTIVATAISRSIGRWFKAKWATKYFVQDATQSIGASPYFVYPIHYQPEASTVVGSPNYADQLNLLTNLAFSMAPGVKLVVKEHISNVGFPSLSFYKALRSLPNVILVWHSHNIKELIRGSQGVITLTSTAGFEALLLNKPVFHFGDVFYTFHPKAKKIDGWGSVRQILQEGPRPADYDNIAFLIAYRRYTHEGKLRFESEDFGIVDLLVNRVESFMESLPARAVA